MRKKICLIFLALLPSRRPEGLLLLVIIVGLFSACSRRTANEQWIDDNLGGVSISCKHHELSARGILMNNVTRESAVNVLQDCLRESKSPRVRHIEEKLGTNDVVRVRDLLALILSEMTKEPLSLYTFDTCTVRDRKIDDFLTRLLLVSHQANVLTNATVSTNTAPEK